MNLKIWNVVLGLAVAFAANTVMGQFATTTVSGDGITGVSAAFSFVDARAAADEAALTGGRTFDLFLDSADDILVIDATLTVCSGSVFNDTDPSHAATDHSPPIPALLEIFGTLNADLWITTPGGTSAADDSNLAAGETVSHFDTSDDGPQSGFHWASLTLTKDSSLHGIRAMLHATIQTAGTPTPMFSDVTASFYTFGAEETGDVPEINCVPEPNAFGLMAFALIGGFAIVRRTSAS